jgi:hypothetical protein
MHSSWNLIHRLPFNHRDEISSSIQSVAYLPGELIQLIFTIRISLVTVPSAEIRPALGKHTWVTVPSLSVIGKLSAVQLYLQFVAIRLGWFLVNSTWLQGMNVYVSKPTKIRLVRGVPYKNHHSNNNWVTSMIIHHVDTILWIFPRTHSDFNWEYTPTSSWKTFLLYLESTHLVITPSTWWCRIIIG